ncbi:MAG: carbohydrate ABC transporter permease [Saccharofermentanales bacterium]
MIQKITDRITRPFKRLARSSNKRKILLGHVLNIIKLILLSGLAFMILFPLITRFSASIKSTADLTDPTVIFIPKTPTLYNYNIVISAINYPVLLLKTAGLDILFSTIQLAACTLVAYGMARFRFRGRNLMFSMVILTMIIPPQTIILPLYFRFKYFGILNIFQFTGNLKGIDFIDTLWPFLLLSLTAVAFRNGLYIYLLRQYFKNLPEVLEEAAYIDGCGSFKTFYKIMLPGAVPMLITVFLFAFVWQWNDQYYAATLTPEIPFLSTVLKNIKFDSLTGMEGYLINQILLNAKLFLLITPLIILYLFAQNFFTESIERSGVVG